MNGEEVPGKARLRSGAGRPPPVVEYTNKDFQLEVLGKLAETQELTKALLESMGNEGRAKSEKLLRFDGRTLVAVGAIALSLTGYILQDARSKTKRDAEIEITKERVTQLERSSETNTEGRIRTEVQLLELREGQVEVKNMVKTQERANRGAAGDDNYRRKAQSPPGGGGHERQ